MRVASVSNHRIMEIICNNMVLSPAHHPEKFSGVWLDIKKNKVAFGLFIIFSKNFTMVI